MRSSTLIGGLLVLFCSFQKIQSAKEYWWMNDASVFGGSNSNNIGQNQQQQPAQQQQQFQNYPNFPQQQQQNQQQISEFLILLIFYTVWKFGDFSVTQILREINFGESRSSKNAMPFSNFRSSKSVKIHKNQNSWPLYVLKWQILYF